jgi:putative transposase
MPYFSRKAPVHFPVVQRHNRSTIVFVTVCTRGRAKVLANDVMHALLVEAWKTATWWQVGRYVVMPDHVHLFAAPMLYPPEPLAKWIRFWKSYVSRSCRKEAVKSLWQPEFWDTQLRRGDSYSEKWEYVSRNPVRAGFALTPEEWPFQGAVNELVWHDQ